MVVSQAFKTKKLDFMQRIERQLFFHNKTTKLKFSIKWTFFCNAYLFDMFFVQTPLSETLISTALDATAQIFSFSEINDVASFNLTTVEFKYNN